MKATIDKAGRVVIPKPIRDRQRLTPGMELDIVETGDHIELIPPDEREQAVLTEKQGRLVISGDRGRRVTQDETLALRDALRERRAV